MIPESTVKLSTILFSAPLIACAAFWAYIGGGGGGNAMSDDECPAADFSPSATTGPVSHALLRVARLHRMLAGALLRETGLYPGQELLMMQLWAAGPQRQSDLVRMLDSDAATMTRTVQRLERAGFVRRKTCPTDRRGCYIEATPASQPLRVSVERLHSRLEELTVAGLDSAERAETSACLAALERNLLTATELRALADSAPA